MGFDRVQVSRWQNGDIALIHATNTHPEGHIQVYYEGNWYSDYIQKGFSPYEDEPDPLYSAFRRRVNL